MEKNILFISDHGDPLAKLGGKQAGGQNNYVRQLALALDKLGFNIDIVTHWSDPDVPPLEIFGENCRVLRIAGGHKGFIDKNEMIQLLPGFYQEMKGLLRRNTYHIVHSHYWLSGLIGLAIRRDFNIPLVHTSHSLGIAKLRGTGKKDNRRMLAEYNILNKADTVIATTANERKLIEEFAGPGANVIESSIGVDFNLFHADKNKMQNENLFTFAGRLEKSKGIFTLFDAFQSLVKSRPETKLLIAGGDDREIDKNNFLPVNEELREAVQGMENNIKFLGQKSQKELAEIFNRSTAVVVPSYYESFGMVAAEAQACGTPVIASKVGGLGDIILDGETGLHVEAKNAKQLSEVMHTCVTNKRLVKKLGEQAAAHSLQLFDWMNIAEQIEATYKSLIGKREKLRVSS